MCLPPQRPTIKYASHPNHITPERAFRDIKTGGTQNEATNNITVKIKLDNGLMKTCDLFLFEKVVKSVLEKVKKKQPLKWIKVDFDMGSHVIHLLSVWLIHSPDIQQRHVSHSRVYWWYLLLFLKSINARNKVGHKTEPCGTPALWITTHFLIKPIIKEKQ